MALDYWHDNQLRRYWLQFTRIFQGFQYQTGIGADGVTTFRTFPVKLASKDRQIGHILRNNSENVALSTPRITVEMTSIEQSAQRRQHPGHVSTLNVVERKIDPTTGGYTEDRGDSYTIERYMAIPYDIEMKVDIWTSNEAQKHQFMEQVLVLFNPAIDLQTGDNPVDWTSLTIVELTGIQWSSRSFPLTDSDIEVSTLTFKMPIWLSPPAKIKRQNIIHQIITNISTMPTGAPEDQIEGVHFSDTDMHTRIIATPNDHRVSVEGNIITLLNRQGLADPTLSWRELLKQYGKFRPGVSQLRLKTTPDMDDHDSDIIGTYDLHPTNENQIVWTADLETLPTNTLTAVDAMINMQGRYPGIGGLPAAATGQRYLLAEDLVLSEDGTNGWTNLEASMNDIIEFDGTNWFVAFDASAITIPQWVLNSTSGDQLRWTGEMWVMAVDGVYNQGYWRIFL